MLYMIIRSYSDVDGVGESGSKGKCGNCLFVGSGGEIRDLILFIFFWSFLGLFVIVGFGFFWCARGVFGKFFLSRGFGFGEVFHWVLFYLILITFSLQSFPHFILPSTNCLNPHFF